MSHSVTYQIADDAANGQLGVAWGGDQTPKIIGPGTEIGTPIGGVGVSLWDGSEVRVAPNAKVIVEECAPCGPCRQRIKTGAMHFEVAGPNSRYEKTGPHTYRERNPPRRSGSQDACKGGKLRKRPPKASAPSPDGPAADGPGADEPDDPGAGGKGGPGKGSGYHGPRVDLFFLIASALNLSFAFAEFVAHVSDDGTTSVAVIEGEVEVETEDGDTMTVAAGETIQYTPGEMLDMPEEADMDELDSWWDEIK